MWFSSNYRIGYLLRGVVSVVCGVFAAMCGDIFPSPCSNSSKFITPYLLVLCKNVQHYILHMGIRAHKPHTIHIIHPTSVIIMNVDMDPNSITASDYALICTHWKVPDPSKAGKQLTTYRCPKEACVSIATKRYAKCDNNLWNDSMVYQSMYNCQQNATNRRRREKEEQFLERGI